MQNGVLTVVLTEDQVSELARRAAEIPDYHLTIDLENRRVNDDHGFSANFQIEESTRHCLLNGLDDIGLTLQHESEIASYESQHPVPAASQQLI